MLALCRMGWENGGDWMNYPKYSVLMSVYEKESADNLRVSIESMFAQTVPLDEFILVIDGPISKGLEKEIEFQKKCHPEIKSFVLEKNVGAGLASKFGILHCSNEYIARMDSDDYSIPTRIQEEFDALFKHNVDFVGCVIDEFVGSISNVVSRRILPETNKQINKYSKSRSPVAHSAVLYKKKQVLACGNYEKFRYGEDMILFSKMLKMGYKAYNIQHPLVYMRVSENFFQRRGGFRYFFKITQTNIFLALKIRWMPLSSFLLREWCLMASCFVPNKLRIFIYKNLLRK